MSAWRRVHRPACPGRNGVGCKHGRLLTRASIGGLCSDCRVNAGDPAPPAAEVLSTTIEREVADAAITRIRGLCRAELWAVIAPAVLEQLLLSVYQQGLLDGQALARR